ENGNDIEAIEEAIKKAKENLNKPSLIKITTEIGYGTSKQGKSSVHGSPLGEEDMKNLKKFLDWEEEEEFTVPAKVKEHMAKLVEMGEKKEKDWEARWEAYKREYPDLAKELENWNSLTLPMDYLDSEEFLEFEKD